MPTFYHITQRTRPPARKVPEKRDKDTALYDACAWPVHHSWSTAHLHEELELRLAVCSLRCPIAENHGYRDSDNDQLAGVCGLHRAGRLREPTPTPVAALPCRRRSVGRRSCSNVFPVSRLNCFLVSLLFRQSRLLQVTPAGSSTASSTAFSPMGRCPRTKPSAAATTLSTPSSQRPVSSDGAAPTVSFQYSVLLVDSCKMCATAFTKNALFLFSPRDTETI